MSRIWPAGLMFDTSNTNGLKRCRRASLSVTLGISSCTASISLASRVRYWQRRSSCCRAMAMRRDSLCMELMTEGSALACRGRRHPNRTVTHDSGMNDSLTRMDSLMAIDGVGRWLKKQHLKM